jgi:hypothetical protein
MLSDYNEREKFIMTINAEYDIEYTKKCAVCGNDFVTKRKNKNICSFLCKAEHNKQHSRYYARQKRLKNKQPDPCIICGFSETSDKHKEGDTLVTLCPNHHCLITRGIKTLEQLLQEKTV